MVEMFVRNGFFRCLAAAVSARCHSSVGDVLKDHQHSAVEVGVPDCPHMWCRSFDAFCLPCRYNQFAFNTLSRVTPVSHGVCNVVKRVCIIGASVLFFGNKLTDQTKLGTAIALVGTYLYTEASKKYGKGAHPNHGSSKGSLLSVTLPIPEQECTR